VDAVFAANYDLSSIWKLLQLK